MWKNLGQNMFNTKCYDLSSKYNDITSIQKSIEIVLNITEKYNKFDTIETMSFDEIDNIIYRLEKGALSCRSALENKKNINIIDDINIDMIHKYNNYVAVDFKDNCLKITSPFTFKRAYRDNSLKENYILMNYIKAALTEWENNNKMSIFRSLKAPLIAMIVRKNTTFDRTKICDNDNMENGRIINEIMNALGYSDNAKTLSIYSTFKIVENESECGMDFIIFSKNDLNKYIHLF